MNNLAFMLINKIIDVVATGDQICAYVEVAKFAVGVEKGEVTVTSKGTASDDMLSDLAHAKGKQCRLTVLDNSQFNTDRREAEVQPDQKGMFDDEPEAAAPPAGEPLEEGGEIIDPETGEILTPDDEQSTADAMADAIKADPEATDEEKAALEGEAEPDPAEEVSTASADSVTENADTETGNDDSATDQADNGADPFQEGLEAAANNAGPDECPYDGGTDEFTSWHEGRNKGLGEIEGLKQEGYDARQDGMAPSRCQWKKGTKEHGWWMQGYDKAKAEESDG